MKSMQSGRAQPQEAGCRLGSPPYLQKPKGWRNSKQAKDQTGEVCTDKSRFREQLNVVSGNARFSNGPSTQIGPKSV